LLCVFLAFGSLSWLHSPLGIWVWGGQGFRVTSAGDIHSPSLRPASVHSLCSVGGLGSLGSDGVKLTWPLLLSLGVHIPILLRPEHFVSQANQKWGWNCFGALKMSSGKDYFLFWFWKILDYCTDLALIFKIFIYQIPGRLPYNPFYSGKRCLS
jgi:hypothetical protein